MKIGIDARMYRSDVAGIGRYSQNLIKNLLEIDSDDQFILFMTTKDAEEYQTNQKSKIKSQNVNQNVKIIIADIPHYSIAEQLKLPKIIAREKVDLMHFLNFNYPVLYRGKFISVIHDLTLVKFPSTAKKTNFFKKAVFNYILKKACQNAAKVIAISEHTKRDIVDEFKVKSEKINVIYEAADDNTLMECDQKNIEALKKKYKIDTPHCLHCPLILYVGQFRPHKNLPSLVEAFDIISRDIPCKLVMLGKIDQDHKRLLEVIDKSPKKSDIVMPGFVSDNELACWYRIASVFAYPSLYEGFGLPGLEAMAAGTPVVASGNSVLPEIYGEAAIYFNPFETKEIADKIKEVLGNEKLRDSLIQKGYEQVKKYSWRKTAEETLQVYKKI